MKANQVSVYENLTFAARFRENSVILTIQKNTTLNEYLISDHEFYIQ